MENGKWRVEKNSAFYMGLALSLARKGLGQTTPNPAVGAVLVKGGQVIGQGYHRRAGLPHAEIEALKEADEKARGATLYVTLEPCNHWAKTGPCTQALIKAGVKEVFFAMRDPNPAVNGQGIAMLRRAGVRAAGPVLEDQAKKLNEVFVHVMTHQIPFVTVKMAQSLDGKIATQNGQSRWITDAAARRYVHTLRNQVDAILVGIETVLKDDPSLTVRGISNRAKQPKRIVLDPDLKIPLRAKIFSSTEPDSSIVITTPGLAKSNRAKRLIQKTRCLILSSSLKQGRFQLRPLLQQLAGGSIHHLLVEGGGETVASFLEQRLVNKVIWFIAPMIIGGRQAPTSVEGNGIKRLGSAIRLKSIEWRRIGRDFCMEGYL